MTVKAFWNGIKRLYYGTPYAVAVYGAAVVGIFLVCMAAGAVWAAPCVTILGGLFLVKMELGAPAKGRRE